MCCRGMGVGMTSSGVPERLCRAVSGPRGAVAAAHPLAVAAATTVLAEGGGAVDAALAAQAVLCVTMPHSAGLGGDMLCLVREPGKPPVAVNGAGRCATTEVRELSGGGTVTVPGLVSAWVQCHERWGHLPLRQVLNDAIVIADTGFAVDADLLRATATQRERLVAGGAANWPLLAMNVGDRWRQPELAALLQHIAESGASAFYDRSAGAMVHAAGRAGGALSEHDFLTHVTHVRAPVTVNAGGDRLFVQPPSSQGVLLALAALEADKAFKQYPDTLRDHLLIEITEAAFEFRSSCADLQATLARRLTVDPHRAARRGGPRAYLHTAGVATADASGLVVSSLVSVFDDFGSAIYVPELGMVLNNRAAGFTDGENRYLPGTKPVHTLAPAMMVRADGSALAVATPGADGQVQTLLQVLAALSDRQTSLAQAVAAPRWRSENARLLIENDHSQLHALAELGHDVELRLPGDDVFGAVVAAGFDERGAFAAADWRRWVTSGAT